jgi:hypothetical protein
MQISRGAAVPLDVTLSALDDAGQLAALRLGPADITTPLSGKSDKAA